MANYVVPYLTRRGNVFWFRMAVPTNLVHRIGRREIKFSLRSSHPSVARMRCRLLTVEILQLMALGPAMPALTKDAIERIARRCFAVAMEQVDDLTAFFVPNDPKLDPTDEADMALEERQKLQQAVTVRPFDPNVAIEAASALAAEGLSRKQVGIEEFDALCSALVRARIEALRIYAAKLSGRYDETAPRDPLFQANQGPEKPLVRPPGPNLAELADRYCEFKSKHEWVAKSAADNRRILGLFIELSGRERPINSLSDEDIRGYRDALMVIVRRQII